MARVCCRRAAGIVIGEYLRKRKINVVSNSAYDQLAIIEGLADINENVKRVSRNFLIKVNQEHRLPETIDLIQDVTWLKEALLVSPGS